MIAQVLRVIKFVLPFRSLLLFVNKALAILWVVVSFLRLRETACYCGNGDGNKEDHYSPILSMAPCHCSDLLEIERLNSIEIMHDLL